MSIARASTGQASDGPPPLVPPPAAPSGAAPSPPGASSDGLAAGTAVGADASVARAVAGAQEQSEAAPNRTESTENFPVASRLLPRRVRPKVLAFYRFVRTADDVADHPTLPPAEKLARLDAMEAALDDPATTRPDTAAIHATGVGTEEARRMLSAFRQDATQHRYEDWAELRDYCARSAAPVGRMLLRVSDSDTDEARAGSDALCEALQVLNHLQDLGPDREKLGRIYLPVPWMAAAGGEAGFFGDSAARRPVLDAALDRVEEALDRAASLPRAIRDRRLGLEAAVILGCARRLLARLRADDPVLGRVALSRADFAAALLAAPRLGGGDAGLVRRRVARAGSSFAGGMMAAGAERRRALHAVYAFCRAVDDIADGEMPAAEKRRALSEWRDKLLAPDCALSRELDRARHRFALPVAECEAMIAGMETDSDARVRIADDGALALYCRRVAGSVGALSVRIFGAPEQHEFGLALGRTFQLVNILRDPEEDALRDRVYLPLSRLAPDADPAAPAGALLDSPGFAGTCAALAAEAEAGFRRAGATLHGPRRRALRPAAIMAWGYGRLLRRMVARGFRRGDPRPRLTRAEKLRMAAMALGLAPVPVPEGGAGLGDPGAGPGTDSGAGTGLGAGLGAGFGSGVGAGAGAGLGAGAGAGTGQEGVAGVGRGAGRAP